MSELYKYVSTHPSKEDIEVLKGFYKIKEVSPISIDIINDIYSRLEELYKLKDYNSICTNLCYNYECYDYEYYNCILICVNKYKDYKFLKDFINKIKHVDKLNQLYSAYGSYLICCTINLGYFDILRLITSHPDINLYDPWNTHIENAIGLKYDDIAILLISHPTIDLRVYTYNIVKLSIDHDRINIFKKILESPKIQVSDIPFEDFDVSYKYKKLIKYHRQLYFFHKINRIICIAIIGNFILKYIIMHPKSRYIARLVSEF